MVETPTDLKPIIILLTGEPGDGKTTTANTIRSHHTHIIHGDSVICSLPKWCSNKKCLHIFENYAHLCKNTDLTGHLNILSKNLNEQCAEHFVAQLLKSRYMDTKKPTIIMEGYVFGLSKIRRELYMQLKNNCYIWEMKNLNGDDS
jgi:hypothetical protein